MSQEGKNEDYSRLYEENKNKLKVLYKERRAIKKELKKVRQQDKERQRKKNKKRKSTELNRFIILRFYGDIEFYRDKIKQITDAIKILQKIEIDLITKLNQADFEERKYFAEIYENKRYVLHSFYHAAGGCFFLCFFLRIGYNNKYYYEYLKYMTNSDFKMKGKMNLEDLGDYSFDLLEEISRFIRELPNSKFVTSNKFIEIFNKLKKAKKIGLNVKKFEDEIFDFRLSLLLRKIANKKNDISSADGKLNIEVLNIESIRDNYQQFENDYETIEELSKSVKDLEEIIILEKIKSMISSVQESTNDSEYDFEKIMNELEKAKELGIDTKELEMQILGE